MNRKHITHIYTLLSQIEQLTPYKSLKNVDISQSDIAWQLDHSLKVINQVCTILLKTNPEKYKVNFNLWRTLFFPLGYFPRGKARAPKKVLPPKIISEQDLTNQLNEAKQLIDNIQILPKRSYFIHPIFGMLSKQQTILFLRIHTNHHLKIVEDILQHKKAPSN